MSCKVFANEKNFVIATVDRSPITYFDLKQKAKLIHFLKTKNNQYKNLNKYFDLNIIPHTLKLTNLKNLKLNEIVNVELDIFGKYIYKYTK